MPTFKFRSEIMAERTAYHAVRRAQACISSYRHFSGGELSCYLHRDSFAAIANRLADKYFHRSVGMAIHDMAVEIYLVLLIMAPIIQRLTLSSKIDWHRGHFVTWFRTQCNNNLRRFNFRVREIERSFLPVLLTNNLDCLGIHDTSMVDAVMDLYRKHNGGTALKDMLAYQLFDPIMMLNVRDGFELRHGNHLYRLEKNPFDSSVDIRSKPLTALDFCMFSRPHKTGRYLEILISNKTLSNFRDAVKSILNMSADPEFKITRIGHRIRDLVERTRPARSAWPQIQELKSWLWQKLVPLAGTAPEARQLPHLLANLWLQRSDSRLFLKSPTFFLDVTKHDEKTFSAFFSPYREV